jgi:DNA adenine methylase
MSRNNEKTPHLVQYQGSKRLLASSILQYMPNTFERLVEPFSGMAAITIAVAQEKRASAYHINDINGPLVSLLKEVIISPENLVLRYEKLWKEQFVFAEGHIQHFYKVREDFNNGDESPEKMLYLLARCVKGSVRYGKTGKFNQSPDKRRHGVNPKNIAKSAYSISCLLRDKSSFSSKDYREIFEMVRPGDLIYIDPPYQGVTNTRDNRYFAGISYEDFVTAIDTLNKKSIDFLISYDGECGGKSYGMELPKYLGCQKMLLNAGLSSQGTLLGKQQTTYEALYISKNLQRYIRPRQLALDDVV